MTNREFSGTAGTIYLQESKDSDDKPIEVWYEDFCLLGTGDSDIEALQDAKQNAENIARLISDAIVTVLTSADVVAATTPAGREIEG